jgi:hypothetical protein
MKRLLFAVWLGSCMTAWSQQPQSPTNAVVDGVYCAACLSLEIIELKNGRLRYWFQGDVMIANEPTYPLVGAYAVKGDMITLLHKDIHELVRQRFFRLLNGKPSLWRAKDWEDWQKTKRFKHGEYWVAFRVDDPPELIWKKWPWEWRKWKQFGP